MHLSRRIDALGKPVHPWSMKSGFYLLILSLMFSQIKCGDRQRALLVLILVPPWEWAVEHESPWQLIHCT